MSNTVIITGASGGIGSAIAHKFAENGWNIAIMYNTSLKDAEKLESELETYGVRVYSDKCDVSNILLFCKVLTTDIPPIMVPNIIPRKS